MKQIPLIIPVFNQLTYLRNLINWWKWYQPGPIYIVDNRSTYRPLLDFYHSQPDQLHVYPENNFIPNLTNFLEKVIHPKFDFYVISDPDIMPHPATPRDFIEVWKNLIETHNFHRVGFNLITDDLPEDLNERDFIIGNEAEFRKDCVITHGNYRGYRAPIDTTFCLYQSKRGWTAPMNGEDWGNCLRLFEAFHLGWYNGDSINEEMKNYFETSNFRIHGEPSAGRNNNRPKQYQ